MSTARPLMFADLLRRHRRAAGLSQEELAQLAGLSRTGISELERGLKRAPHKDTVVRLADALGLAGGERAMFEAVARGRAAQYGPRQAIPSWPLASPQDALAEETPLPRPPGLVSFVGRLREVARLGDILARHGPPLLLLAGEPGIGKSRLLRAGAERARDAGWTVLEGGCQRRGGQPPFAPVLEALARHHAGRAPAQHRLDLDGASWLVRLLPELAETVVVPTPRWTLPPEQERHLMFSAVARYLANVSGPAGTLLVLDDLQWAGMDALELLGFLVSSTRLAFGSPLLLLGAYRSTEVSAGHPLPHLLADLSRDGLADELRLGPLAPAESRSLLEGMFEDTVEDAARRATLIDRLVERAGGVPFYLVSCARAALAEAERDTDESAHDLPVPWDVAQSIRQRIALLPHGAADLLGGAAVAGRRIERTVVEALSAWLGLEGNAAAATLAAALHARLLLEDGDNGYRFAHDLVREVAAADLGAWRRRAAHRVIAEGLERHLSEKEVEQRAAELAYHFVRSGEILRALPYLELAGQRAQARHANAETERIYRELMRLYDELGRPLDTARAAERLGKALTDSAHHDEALGVLVLAASTLRQAGDLDGYARAMAAVGRVHATNGTSGVGIAELESVLRTLETEQPSRGVVAIHIVLAWLYWISGSYREQAAAAERAAASARALGDDAEFVFANAVGGMALAMLGRLEESVPLLEAALPQVEARGDLESFGLIVTHVAEAYAYLGQFNLFGLYSMRVRELAELLGNPLSKSYACYWLGVHAFYTGEWQHAQTWFIQCRALAEQVMYAAVQDSAAGYALLGLGQLHSAYADESGAQFLDEALALARRGLPPRMLRPVQGCLAERDLLAGRAEDALARLDPLLNSPEGADGVDATPLLPFLAWSHLDRGDLPGAEEVLREALARSRDEHHHLALLDALRVQALLALRNQRWDVAAAALDEAIALARTMPYPYAEAKALYVYGLLHLAKGEPQPARERFAQALAILDRLGERLYAARIEQTLADMQTTQ